LWLRVGRIVRLPYGNGRLIGHFVTDSLLMPRFGSGEPLSVHWSEILDWKCDHVETTVNEP
jgi:hypothetical protein